MMRFQSDMIEIVHRIAGNESIRNECMGERVIAQYERR